MKPFDLEAAMRGEPIQLKNGEKCTFGAFLPSAAPSCQVVIINPQGYVISRYKDGRFEANKNCSSDIVMVPKIKTYWINIYKGKFNEDRYTAGSLLNSEETAKEMRKIDPTWVKTISFEVEE